MLVGHMLLKYRGQQEEGEPGVECRHIILYKATRTNEKQMRHTVNQNVSETGFENGGWLGPPKDHAGGGGGGGRHLYEY